MRRRGTAWDLRLVGGVVYCVVGPGRIGISHAVRHCDSGRLALEGWYLRRLNILQFTGAMKFPASDQDEGLYTNSRQHGRAWQDMAISDLASKPELTR